MTAQPQAMYFAESLIEQVSQKTELDPEHVRRLNFIKEGDHTHYNQEVTACRLRKGGLVLSVHKPVCVWLYHLIYE